MNRRIPKPERRCEMCGRRFFPIIPRQLYCGKRCATYALAWELEGVPPPPQLRGRARRDGRPE